MPGTFLTLRSLIAYKEHLPWKVKIRKGPCQRRYLTSKKAPGTIGPVFHPTSSLVVGYFSVPTSPKPLIIRLRINFARTNSTWESGRALPFNLRSESTIRTFGLYSMKFVWHISFIISRKKLKPYYVTYFVTYVSNVTVDLTNNLPQALFFDHLHFDSVIYNAIKISDKKYVHGKLLHFVLVFLNWFHKEICCQLNESFRFFFLLSFYI